jgi:hypothetical protein
MEFCIDSVKGKRDAMPRLEWQQVCIGQTMSQFRRWMIAAMVATGTMAAEDTAKLAVSARTAADHRRVADLYRTEADKYAKKAEHFRKLAEQQPRMIPNEGKHPMAPGTRGHSLYFLAKSEEKASEARSLEARHREMAAKAEQLHVE